MKNIAVYFDHPDFDEYPFTVEEFRNAYHELGALVSQKGHAFHIVRGQPSYHGNNEFSHSWIFENGAYRASEKPVRVDVIYDKGHFIPDETARLSNHRKIYEICGDKWNTYQHFPTLLAPSFLVSSQEELDQSLNKITTSIAVAKPLQAEEGRGVFLLPPEEMKKAEIIYPSIIQEFIDTSAGIEGLVDTHHDFRMININGELVLCYIRTPPPGKLRANVAQGGREIQVPPEKIPEGAWKNFKAVDEVLKQFGHRTYSVDQGRNIDGTWRIIELNSRPAINQHSLCVYYPNYQNQLTEALIAAAHEDHRDLLHR